MGKVDLVRFESPDALARAAATAWLNSLPAAGPHFAAFSGGRVAATFFDATTTEVRARNASLQHVDFFWADERCVPANDRESNYGLMHSRLLEPLKVHDDRVHRIEGEIEPATAAQRASREFDRVVRPVLDFVFLGMGEDGHIASIFPGDAIQESPTGFYRPVVAPKPPSRRITLAMHAMVAARNAWVLASGNGKEEALRKSLEGASTPLGVLLQRRDFTRIFTSVLS